MKLVRRVMDLFSTVGIELSAQPQAGTRPAPGGAIETVTVAMSVDEARSLIGKIHNGWSEDDMTVPAHLGLLLGEHGMRLGVVGGSQESGRISLKSMDSRDVDALEHALTGEPG